MAKQIYSQPEICIRNVIERSFEGESQQRFFLYQQKRYKGMVISRSRGGGIKKIAYENHFAKKKLLCWKINLPKPHSKGKYEN